MGKVYLPSKGAAEWQRLLADPVKHWRTGYSARALAHCWEEAPGLPPEIAKIFEQAGENPELLIALAEHKVPLPGSARGESQNDIFALVRVGTRTFAVTVEGKVDESFDKPLGRWLQNASRGKLERLTFIADLLGLSLPLPNDVHYQLLHRIASAVIEARRFKTDGAVMLIHSFSPQQMWFDAFQRFVELFGCVAAPGKLIEVRSGTLPLIFVAWASGESRFLTA